MDLRKRVIAACDEGQTIAQVAQRFKVSASFVNQLRQRRKCGTLDPKPHGGGRQPRLSSEHDQRLRALLAAKPDTTLMELRDKLGVKVRLSSLWYRLQRLGLTFKKTLAAAEQGREDVRLQRDAWQAAQPLLDPARLVFIDETGLDTAMVRRYGWGPGGQRVRGAAPQGHGHTSTFVAALRQQGLTAPMVIPGTTDGACFKAYVKEFLCPTLAPGDIVVWDNLSSHQVAGVREAIEAVGATLKPLPPLQPRFQSD
jgi:transposase